MALLEIRNIDVFYGDVQVVFDLSLQVEEGEVVSIIGGNGAGNSTLLRTISGLMQPSKGEITFEGKPIHHRPPEEVVERGIVQVPEGRRLFSLMSVQDNLIVGASTLPRCSTSGRLRCPTMCPTTTNCAIAWPTSRRGTTLITRA